VAGELWHGRWAIAWTMLASLGAAHVLWNGLLVAPTDWDSLAYHLPLADHWLREGTLYVPDCAFWYCPGNNEVWALWAVAPFSGDYLAMLNNVPAAGLLAVSVVELGRLLGLRPGLYHPAAMAVLVTEPVRRQLVSAENDVAVAALFVTSLVYGGRYVGGHRRAESESTAEAALVSARPTYVGRWADLIWMSACVGLLAGVKYYALGYAAVAAAGVLGLVLNYGWRAW
jgi:hypothetical protein